MKKLFLVVILTVITNCVFAQTMLWFQSTAFAAKVEGSDWTDWESSEVDICFDLVNDNVTIFSPQTQYYHVITQLQAPYDPNGIQEKYLAEDLEGYYYYIRLRIQNDGTSQIYIDGADYSIVYNVIRTN